MSVLNTAVHLANCSGDFNEGKNNFAPFEVHFVMRGTYCMI